MTPNSSEADAFSQLDELTNKRTALESLIAIATSIHRQQTAMEGLAFIARPSQEIPAKTIQHLQVLEQKYVGLADDELTQWLLSIEEATLKVIEKVATFAQLELHELRDNEIKGLSVEGFKSLIADFEQRTQTSLALRFLLKKRGVVLAAFKLPFPQESISERIDALKEKENRCVAQIKTEAQSIIDDTNALLANAHLADKMKQQLQSVRQAMEANLQHLDGGGSVMDIPNKFEVIVLQSDPPAGNTSSQTKAPAVAKPPANESKPATEVRKDRGDAQPKAAIRRKKLSTLRLLIRWLTTPLNTSWKELKKANERGEL